jgi:uncharacterized membrane protein YadS
VSSSSSADTGNVGNANIAAANETFDADIPHFIIRFLNFAIIDSFLHFLTAPDNISSSERDRMHIGTHE